VALAVAKGKRVHGVAFARRVGEQRRRIEAAAQ